MFKLIKMNRTKNNLPIDYLRKEFIGKKVRISSSTKADDVGREGIIVNETLSTIEIFENDSVKRFIKKNLVFDIFFEEDVSVSIPGNLLELRPEDRIKKVKV